MKISDAINHFQGLASKTDNTRQRKVYDKFIGVLSDLKNHDLTEEQVLLIERKMDELNLKVDTETTKRKLNQKLRIFINFLKTQLSLVTPRYYTALGMAFGVAFGVALAPTLERQLGISISMGVGMLIGLFVGQYLDNKADKENRVLRMKL